MARRRGNLTNRNRGRRQVRTQLRQIHRALSFEPRRISLVADPPPLNHTFSFANIIPFYLQFDKNSKENIINPGSGTDDPTITFAYDTKNKSFIPADIRYDVLFKAWANWTGHKADATAFHVDVCVSKVSYWGPATSGLTAVAIGLAVDVPAPGSSASVTDVGTTTVRARCALSLPCMWQLYSSQHVVIRIDCDNEGTLSDVSRMKLLEETLQLGILHVSMNVRFTKST